MKSRILQFLQILILVFSIANIAIAQPEIGWVKVFGADYLERGEAVTQVDDGGYIAVGNIICVDDTTASTSDDWWIIKVDDLGNLQWEKCLDVEGYDDAVDVKATMDNGCIVTGHISDDESNSEHNGITDYYVMKLDSLGEVEWERFYGGTPSEFSYTISLTSDAGYVVAGSRKIYKLDALGNIEWEERYGGTQADIIYSIKQISDLGYVAAGYTKSDDGDVAMNQGEEDVWIIKLDVNGKLEWSKTYGGSGEDQARAVEQTDNGGYIVGGYTESHDGDIANNYGEEDYWILKLDANGNLEWEKNFGGQEEDICRSLQKTSDGGYVLSGSSRSSDSDVTNNLGLTDIWILKIDDNGNLEWKKNYGGSGNDYCTDVRETMDGGFISTGFTSSDDDFGNQVPPTLFGNLFIMKLAPLSVGLNESTGESKIRVFPNPNSGFFTVNTSLINTPLSIVVHDVNGKVIYTKTELNEFVEIDNLANGVYFLSLQSKDKIYFEKIIVH